mgnify:CR=1 FL=1
MKALIELHYLPSIAYFSALYQAEKVIIEKHELYLIKKFPLFMLYLEFNNKYYGNGGKYISEYVNSIQNQIDNTSFFLFQNICQGLNIFVMRYVIEYHTFYSILDYSSRLVLPNKVQVGGALCVFSCFHWFY